MRVRRSIIRACTTCGLAGLAATGTAKAENPPSSPSGGEIIIYGRAERYDFEGLLAEDELQRDDIDAYGLDTVGQIIEQVSSELQQGQNRPTILINGQLVNGIDDVNDLPVEAVTKIQLLPPAAGVRIGQSPSQRVINVVIKPDHRQITPNVLGTLSTRGDALRAEGELNLLKLANGNRRSLVLRYTHIDPLFEEQRGILPDLDAQPAHPIGNVLGSPAGSEIDPRLSALAGQLALVAAVPAGIVRPQLFDFANRVGDLNRDGANAFRTLVGETDAYSANANVSQRLGTGTVWALNAKIERVETRNFRGLSAALLRLPQGSPFSPFGRDVQLAYQFGAPLEAQQRLTNINLAQTLNSRIGRFGVSAQLRWSRRNLDVDSDRSFNIAGLQSGIDGGTINPFAGIPASALGDLRQDRSRSRADNIDGQVGVNGALATLPAGQLLVSLTARAVHERVESVTQGVTIADRVLVRDQAGIRGNVTVPLVRSSGELPFNLAADLSGQWHGVDGARNLRDWGIALNGNLGAVLSVGASYLEEQIAPQSTALNDAVVVSENIRAFDFIRQETVLVRQISGGNPLLPIQRRRTSTLQANLRPFSGYDFVANAQYARISNLDVTSPLPPASAELQAAFPDRFRRAPDGTLIEVDARPVSFLRDRVERLSWGIRLRRNFGGAAIGEEDDAAPAMSKGRGLRLNLDVTHEHFLAASRQARATLPVIDLLQGGALGYGGGQVRDTVNFNLGAASRGVGLQLNGQYRGPSFIAAGTLAAPERLTFEDRTLVNLRIFANLGPILPEEAWAKGLRVAVQATNLFDSRQRVRDEAGATPLRYQAFLIDPVGRSITLSLRKAF